MEQVASQYDGGLPELSVERAALIMPRRIDGKVDLEVCKLDSLRFVFSLAMIRVSFSEVRALHRRNPLTGVLS